MDLKWKTLSSRCVYTLWDASCPKSCWTRVVSRTTLLLYTIRHVHTKVHSSLLCICTPHGYLGKLGMIFNAKKKSQAIVRSLLCAIRCVNLFHGRRATLLLDVFVTLRNELDGVVRVVSPKWDTHMPGRRVRDCRVSTVCRRVCAMFVYQPILSKQTHWESGVRRMC